MDDVPPDFATIPPDTFDKNLPKITLQDLETLRAEFPNIAESLSMPDRNVLSSLLTKSFNQASELLRRFFEDFGGGAAQILDP